MMEKAVMDVASSRHLSRLAAVAIAALCAQGCGPSGTRQQALDTTGVINGQTVTVLPDPNSAGQASSLRVESVYFGRLVDIYDSEDRDGNPATPETRTLQRQEFLIGADFAADGANYLLEQNPITGKDELTILADANGDYVGPLDAITQREKYALLFEAVSDTAAEIPATPTGAAAVPPFPMIPRNATVAVRFNDLLSTTSANGQTIRMSVGVPPQGSFQARVLLDPNHGAFLNGTFFSTRVLLDPTVSEFESGSGSLQLNSLGLPESTSANILNGAIRIPTVLNASVGQFQLLRNLSGSSVRFNGNGPTENNATLDVVRGFRTGSRTDTNRGFLPDPTPPQVRGVQGVALPSAPQIVTPDSSLGEIATGSSPDRVFLTTFDFAAAACAATPAVGDFLIVTGNQFPEIYAQVTRQGAPPQGGRVTDVRVRLLRFPTTASYAAVAADFLTATVGRFETTYRPGPGVSAPCFLEISPAPATLPATGIPTSPRITVRFTEAVDPETIRPFDNFRLDTEVTEPPRPDRIVVGSITPTPDLREFRYSPILPLDHVLASSETVFFNLVGGATGVRDLAGNALANALPAKIPLTIDPNQATSRNGGIVLRFSQVNEYKLLTGATTGLPVAEIRGQFKRNLAEGFIEARDVTRRSFVLDKTTVPNFSLKDLFLGGTFVGPVDKTPINPLGNRVMSVWRYSDVGLELYDEQTMNVDVEGMSWAARSSQVTADFFDQFEIGLSHSSRLPDDFITSTGTVVFPSSGLLAKFDDNVLNDPNNQKRIVHVRDRGYLVDPQTAFTSSSGTVLVPYPLNRGIPAEQFRYYTWRDTAIQGVGGADGPGAPVAGHLVTGLFGLPNAPCLTKANVMDGGMGVILFGGFPPDLPGAVRSLGLPLLMEFKCFPDNSTGLNSPLSFSMVPCAFRAYSSGSFNPSNQPTSKNPDAEITASGAFNNDPTITDFTGAMIPVGTTLPGLDAVAYGGQLDLVVRVSRVHSRWLATGATVIGFPDYADPIVEPRADQQPQGTSVLLAFRGASQVTPSPVTPVGTASVATERASNYDEYGEPIQRIFLEDDGGTCAVLMDDVITTVNATGAISVSFPNGDRTWKPSIHSIDGSPFVQVRITFISNTATGERPRLSTLALPFRRS